MLEKYYNYKIKYNNCVILIKIGSFYESFENDALIVNKLFDYKITKVGSLIKCGFPISKINTITSVLTSNCINYVVIDADEKYNSFDDNKYNSYVFNLERIKLSLYMIEKLNELLMSKILDDDIIDKLNFIEDNL